MERPAKLGVFLCQGGRNTADSLEYKQLRWTAEAATDCLVFELPQTCQTEGAAAIARLSKEHGLQAAVVGACPLLKNPGGLSRALQEAELDPEMALVLDLCQKPEGEGPGVCEVIPGAQAALNQALCSQAFRAQAATESLRVATGVLVIGDGLTALLAANSLAQAGYPVTLLTPTKRLAPPAPLLGNQAAETAASLARKLEANDRVSLFRQARLLSLNGGAGDFTANIIDRGGQKHQIKLGAALVALGPPLELNLAGSGLEDCQAVMSLSRFLSLLGSPEHLKKRFGEAPLRVAFALGLGRQSDPLSTRAAARAARQMDSDPKARVVLFPQNAKVAGKDLEQITQDMRGEGVVMVKFTSGGLEAKETAKGLELVWDEEVLGAKLSQEFDVVVVDEIPAPDASYLDLVPTLGLPPAAGRHLQPDRVNALPTFSDRGGIFLLGPARGLGEPERWQDEVAETLLDIKKLLAQGEVEVEAGQVQVDRKRCTICLTCVRVCPQGAMGRLERRPVYNPLICTGCGTCAAECPMEAIQLVGQEDLRFQGEIEAAAGRVGDLGLESPRDLLVFLCTHSAAQAFKTARLAGAPRPDGVRLVEVPCAGKLDPDMVLEAFGRGFDGVLALYCHEDACYSLSGNTWAGYR
jgi:heterodisulfide reductase subunit A-like polyferredoxin